MRVITSENTWGFRADSDAFREQVQRVIGNGHSLIPVSETVRFVPFKGRAMTMDRRSIINKFLEHDK